jgi:ABC-type uncharacterized transport system ATPase subunit
LKPKKKWYAVSKHLHLRILKPCSLNNYDGLAVHHGQQSFLTIFLLLLGEFQVLLMPWKAAGVCMNLTAASNVFLVVIFKSPGTSLS